MASQNSLGHVSDPIISTALQTHTTAANTTLLQAYDVDGASYTTFATLTANNTPTMDLSDAVTKASGYIYRAGGTDIPVTDGGTGVSTLTLHGLLLGNGTSAVQALAEATNGQIPIGSTGNNPTLAVITGSLGITVTNGAGTIALSNSTGGMTWTEVTGTSSALVVGNGYIASNAGLVTLTLPATAALGDTIKIVGKGAGLWKLAQNANQFVNIVSTTTTVGAGGSLTATEQFDCLTIICTTAGASTGWIAAEIVGNLTVV
jgi:hypothetical protein